MVDSVGVLRYAVVGVIYLAVFLLGSLVGLFFQVTIVALVGWFWVWSLVPVIVPAATVAVLRYYRIPENLVGLG